MAYTLDDSQQGSWPETVMGNEENGWRRDGVPPIIVLAFSFMSMMNASTKNQPGDFFSALKNSHPIIKRSNIHNMRFI